MQLTQCGCFAQTVEGIVVDVGWYRTTIRSFEREIFCIPNSVFSRNVVLNVTRKQREWRFYEFIGNLPQILIITSPTDSFTLLLLTAAHLQACGWTTLGRPGL